MKYTWLVAAIFTLQTVLPGAAPPCDCVAETQAPAVNDCCEEAGGPCCCTVTTQHDEPSRTATVTAAPSVQLIATPTSTARPLVADSRPTSLKLTAEAHPTSLWSAVACAERAPPLS